MLFGKLDQHIHVGRVAGLLRCLVHRLQPKLVEEHVRKLRGGVDVEFLTGKRINVKHDLVQFGRNLFGHLLQKWHIDLYTGRFHVGQHTRQWQLDFVQ